MKKLAVLVIFLVCFVVTTFADLPIVVSYHKHGCFPGCGDVQVTTEECWICGECRLCKKISCSGMGFQGCPSSIVQGSGVSGFQANASNDMLEYALNQIEAGNYQGTYGVQYYNTDTEELSVFTVEWNKVGVDEDEDVQLL